MHIRATTRLEMDPLETPKMVFMSNHGNYYYNFMPSGLKNSRPIYQRLIDTTFSHHIGHNLEFYVDNMLVKTVRGHIHAKDLEDILLSLKKYNMHLNPAK